MSGYLELHWLPPHNDFSAELAAVKIALEGDPNLALKQATRLAGFRLDYMQTLKLDRLMSQLFQAKPAALPELRLALVGTATIDHLLPPLRVAGARRRIKLTTHAGHFGQYRQEIMQSGSELHQFKPDFLLIAPESQEIMGDIPLGASLDQIESAIGRAVQSLVDLWRLAQAQMNVIVIQQSILHTGFPLFGSIDG